jgi:RNA polymerase sigma factor (sigma-70 family)
VTNHPDRVIANAVLAGERGAFEGLVASHQRLCWHIIYRMVRCPEDTRDLCQETFLRVFRSLHQFRGEQGLKSWIGRIAYTVALRHLESRRVPIVDSSSEADEESALAAHPSDFDLERACADEQLARYLHEEIELLPPLLRTLLTLYYQDDLQVPVIAEITGLPAGTIKSYLFRARLRLRHRLEMYQR